MSNPFPTQYGLLDFNLTLPDFSPNPIVFESDAGEVSALGITGTTFNAGIGSVPVFGDQRIQPPMWSPGYRLDKDVSRGLIIGFPFWERTVGSTHDLGFNALDFSLTSSDAYDVTEIGPALKCNTLNIQPLVTAGYGASDARTSVTDFSISLMFYDNGNNSTKTPLYFTNGSGTTFYVQSGLSTTTLSAQFASGVQRM